MRQGEGGIDIFRMEDGGIICNSISLLQKCVLLTDFEWVFITDIRTMVDGGWWLEFVDAAKKNPLFDIKQLSYSSCFITPCVPIMLMRTEVREKYDIQVI